MKRTYALVLAVAVGVAGCEKPAPEPPAPAKEAPVANKPPLPAADVKDLPPALAEVAKERNKLHKRQTGALLTLTARWEKRPLGGPVPTQGLAVIIDWTIDYDGPRHPFIVLSPDLFPQAFEQTAIHFWSAGDGGQTVPFRVAAEIFPGDWEVRRDHFSVARDGKPVAGQLVVYEDRLRQAAGRRFGPADVLLVQLEHAPRDRGDDTGTILDAWTGRLWSNAIPVTRP
jgi:hypothetical protein